MDRVFVLLPIEEVITAIFWAITYLLICISGFLSKDVRKIAMPYVPGVLNYAWEVNALVYSHGVWVYDIWWGLDMLIVFWGIYFLDSKRMKIIYIISVIMSTICLKMIFSFEYGALVTVFLIDLVMAISYLVRFKSLSPFLKKEIAIFRFLGDFFAGVAGIKYSPYYAIFSIIVCILNGIYVYKCFFEKSDLNCKIKHNLKYQEKN